MVINKKIKRTMLENKSQYIGSLFLIIISCMLYTMFNQLTSSMKSISYSFEKNYYQEDASFIADKQLTNIADLETKFNMRMEQQKTLDYKLSEGNTLRLFSENKKVNLPAIIEGNALTGGDIIIDPAYAKANAIKVGDNITIASKSFKVSGFMSLPNYIYVIKQESDILNDPKSFGIASISKEDLNKLSGGNISYAIRFNERGNVEANIAKFKAYLKEQNIIVLKWSNITDNPRVTYETAKVQGIEQMSSSMPIFILLLTCILTGIVIWRMLKKEFASIGTLYSFGYRKKEIMRHYITFPLSIAVVGGVIGTILGALTVKPMLKVMLSYFNMPMGNIHFDLKYVIISIILPIVFLGVCGYFVVNRALKYSPLDLMRGGAEKNKVGFIEKRLKLDKLKFSTKFKVREQLRSIPRSIFLLLGITFATMLLLMGFVMKSSMDYLVKDTYENTYKYQYQYLFNSLQTKDTSGGEGFSISPFTLKSDEKQNLSVYGIAENTQYIYLKDEKGEKLDTSKVLITKPLADKLKLKTGDTLKLINKIDSKEYDIAVDGIADTYVGEYIYMPINNFNSMLSYPKGSYMGVWSKDNLNIPESKLLSTATLDDFKNAFDALTKPMQAYVGAIAFMAFIIGLIVIYVVTSLIIEENKENISLMKVLGYKKKEVYSLILNSSSFIVVLGYIIGIPLLLASINEMINSASKSMNLAFPIRVNYIYAFIGFVVIYLTYEVSKAVSRRKVNRISMTEALKSRVE
ncbi:ABC transporter permease [Clostridium manihotivorum]|uniref:Permease n=1 Tax=Clostridium manihotivorum TaxID=2320868 RepID=A0A410DN56_9CLOT|nr:FtsX-like permease family protein [Clostridium manihotivorum]QAA30522.1 permease [Clostridium manihotivorum]